MVKPTWPPAMGDDYENRFVREADSESLAGGVSSKCVMSRALLKGTSGAAEKGASKEDEVAGISGEKGLWSVAEEAFLPRGAFEGQWSGGGFLLRRLCLRRWLSPFISRM